VWLRRGVGSETLVHPGTSASYQVMAQYRRTAEPAGCAANPLDGRGGRRVTCPEGAGSSQTETPVLPCRAVVCIPGVAEVMPKLQVGRNACHLAPLHVATPGKPSGGVLRPCSFAKRLPSVPRSVEPNRVKINLSARAIDKHEACREPGLYLLSMNEADRSECRVRSLEVVSVYDEV
jgi:hypothetical protein